MPMTEIKPIYRVSVTRTARPLRPSFICRTCRRPLGTVSEDANGNTYLKTGWGGDPITGGPVQCPFCGVVRRFIQVRENKYDVG